MSVQLLDTHPLLWALARHERLPAPLATATRSIGSSSLRLATSTSRW